jgi:thioester reductase-like protein
MKNVLVTGGTGFLGTGLLHYFDYKSFEGSIYLLIRDKKDKSALSRFNEIKKQFHKLKLFLVTVSLFKGK